jgi:hypothetical protein
MNVLRSDIAPFRRIEKLSSKSRQVYYYLRPVRLALAGQPIALGIQNHTFKIYTAARQIRGKDLDSYEAAQTAVRSAIDLAHATGTKRRLDLIGAEFVPRVRAIRACITDCAMRCSGCGGSGRMVG